MKPANKIFQNGIINIAVFLCGGCIMVLELVGSRLMAPYLGTSIYVWTSLIGIVLGSLALGYWFGGHLADRKPDIRLLAVIILSAGISLAITAIVGDGLLIYIQTVTADVRVNSALATILLFGIPSTLLGMVAPFSVRLKLVQVDKSGSTTGHLYALSTLGSIVGTFLTGYYLLSYFSHRDILLFLGSTLMALALLLSKGGCLRIVGMASLMVVAGLYFTRPFLKLVMGPTFVDEHTAYNRVWIYDAFTDGRPIRVMQLNDTLDSVIFKDSTELVLNYAKYFRLAGHFHTDIHNALMIGGGAFTYPMHFLAEFTNATMRVVEIDPGLTSLSKKYFNLRDDNRLTISHEDGRTFLNTTTGRYDVIFGDAYKSFSVPFQLASVEAMERIHQCLEDDGVFAVNIITGLEGENGNFLRAFLATMDKVFPQVILFATEDKQDRDKIQNVVAFAFKETKPRNLTSTDPEINSYLSHYWSDEISRDKPALTDKLAPVELYAKSLILNNPDLRTGYIQKKMKDFLEN